MGWNVENLEPIDLGFEDNTVDMTFTYTYDPLPEELPPFPFVTGYTAAWVPGPRPSQIAYEILPGGVRVTAPDMQGLFPIQISYLLNRVQYTVNSWDLLPPEAQAIFRYQGSPVTSATFSLDLEAQLSDLSTRSIRYEFIVFTNYSIGKERLLEELALRAGMEV